MGEIFYLSSIKAHALSKTRIDRALRASRIEERPPRAQARAEVVQVDVLHLREQLWEERIAWMAIAQPVQQLERVLRLLLVPQIDHLQLIVSLIPEQRAVLSRAQH